MSKVPEWNKPRKHPSEFTEADLREWIGSMSAGEKAIFGLALKQVEDEERAAKMRRKARRKPARVCVA